MKAIMGWAITASVMAFGVSTINAQTNTNVVPKVQFIRLNLNINLLANTNGTPETNGSIATVRDGGIRLTSKRIIDLLEGLVVFPIEKLIDGSGVPRPHLGAGVMTNFTANARLVLLQALGTNHGQSFIAIRDRTIDYYVSQYFSFDRRGFPGFADDFVTASGRLNQDNGIASETRVYLGQFSFDDRPANADAADRVAFIVDGYTVETRQSIRSGGQVIDPGLTISQINTNAVGTGAVSNSFAVLHGSVSATLDTPFLVSK
jgi:hypothetical protein